MKSTEKSGSSRSETKALTDAERHARFVETAREAEADETEEGFERAFKAVVAPHKAPSGKPE